MTSRFTVTLLVVWTLMTACVSAPDTAPVEHLLRPPLDEGTLTIDQTPYAAIDRLSVAPYLDREGIVVETGDNRVQAATGHRWAEPLSISVRRLLQVGISRALERPVAATPERPPSAEVFIDVSIHQLHGSVEGNVVLAAEWRLREPRTGRILSRHELVRSTSTEAAGYDALVEAHEALLLQLACAIATSLEPAAGA